ncbi:uroporphyrinogen-III synthase [Novosphingobium sp. FSY-8]|uniref:Uroporphyrinogen-III synthase n=1 Tax=Novosphingobium ovatum TaxID=1908523 RepID=A0ABW9XFZ2_9SPHN|nr:uroporphyrinogen-III synthase [Novosphingobium ovatum]NBC37467.1 uroporphyrinogen-III synthase [Novosphingobium ovatum]
MRAPVIIIRPAPGDAASLAAADALGLDAFAFPLFQAAPVAWTPPAPDTCDALLLGSANAVRLAGDGLDGLRLKPAWCVGDATAAAARAAGLSVAGVGAGGLQPLIDAHALRIAGETPRLLRLAARDRVDLTPPPGVSIAERIVYASAPVPMPDTLGRLLQTHALPGFVLLLHSAAAARHFIAQCERLHIPRHRIAAIAIAPRVTAACGDPADWAALATAPVAADQAMLALAAQMCQTLQSVFPSDPGSGQ